MRQSNYINLFVYGTFLKNDKNHWRLSGSELVGQGVLSNHVMTYIQIRDFKASPAVFEGNGIVLGEVYSVRERTIESLDIYEGPEYIRQKKITIDGQEVEIYMPIGKVADYKEGIYDRSVRKSKAKA
jgi:gamma-glutamylcyclotransferase (GGCT)/AIG2-like uncharacterized protein YtfP